MASKPKAKKAAPATAAVIEAPGFNPADLFKYLTPDNIKLAVGLFTAVKALVGHKADTNPGTGHPQGSGDDAFPDDAIDPVEVPALGAVRARLARVQLNRHRFPEAYTDENPFGLLYNLDELESGKDAIPYGSKVWIDLTPFTKDGKEIMTDQFVKMGLAFKTEHHLGGAFIKGNGAVDAAGTTPRDYEANDTPEVGNGETAWKSSHGCLHQMKVFREGSFEGFGSIGGVESNHFTIKVS